MDNGVLKLEVQKDRTGVTANLIKEHLDVIDPIDVSLSPGILRYDSEANTER